MPPMGLILKPQEFEDVKAFLKTLKITPRQFPQLTLRQESPALSSDDSPAKLIMMKFKDARRKTPLYRHWEFESMVLECDVKTALSQLPSDSVQCVVTSPPYWGLRDYGIPGQIGLESSMAEFIQSLTTVFEQVRRVLKPDGVPLVEYW